MRVRKAANWLRDWEGVFVDTFALRKLRRISRWTGRQSASQVFCFMESVMYRLHRVSCLRVKHITESASYWWHFRNFELEAFPAVRGHEVGLFSDLIQLGSTPGVSARWMKVTQSPVRLTRRSEASGLNGLQVESVISHRTAGNTEFTIRYTQHWRMVQPDTDAAKCRATPILGSRVGIPFRY